MKKMHKYFAGAALLMLATGCSHELWLDADGEGRLVLNTSVSTDMKVVSRADQDTLLENCIVWINNEKGVVRRYNGAAEIPGSIDLVTGSYIVRAWTGDSVPASWDKRWYKGEENFTISAGETETVNLECRVANVGVTVEYAEGIEEVLNDFTLTVGHQVDTLMFVGRETRRGYFMMPSFDKNLAYTLKGKQIDGSDFEYSGIIENAKPATEYALKVDYTKPGTDVGGAMITIIIDEHEIVMNTNVNLVAPPKITGYGFDIANPVMAEKGTMGRKCVYITSATKVERVELKSEEFRNFAELGGNNSFEILQLSDENAEIIRNHGITWKNNYDAEKDETIVQLNFEESFTNILDNGDYAIEIKAIDKNGKNTTATLNLVVSDAPVVTLSASSVGYYKAVLNGRSSKDDVTGQGFKYRRQNESQWTRVEADNINGLDFSATITGLDAEQGYEFAAVSTGFDSPVTMSFTTLSTEQLPNAGFEDWYTYNGKILIPGKNYTSNFWDSGNHGSTTIGGNITNSSTKYVHEGQFSASLQSQFVGAFGIGKFAAGNVFAGKYLGTEGMDGVLGWGRPFTGTPKKVTAWVKYEPGTVQSGKDKGSGDILAVGDKDQGIIYMALLDNQKKGDFNGDKWPCVIKTKTTELFDKNGDNVIAYGEYVFETATDGSDLIKIEFPLNYLRPGVTPSNIIFVASASRYGDYFQGGEGSTLYLDDIQLIYED